MSFTSAVLSFFRLYGSGCLKALPSHSFIPFSHATSGFGSGSLSLLFSLSHSSSLWPSRYSFSAVIISLMACSSVALSFSVRSIPAFTLLATSARSCCASGVVSWRSLSIASFLHFSPSGFHRNSSNTSPTMYPIAVLIAHAFEPSPANAPDALNIVFIICGLFW